MAHEKVRHPSELVKRPARGAKKVNDWAALRLAGVYGAAATIWAFAAYSLFGAAVSNSTQNHMLYWSNAAQLVFCPLMVYVGNLIGRGQQAKADADHEALTHIATTMDEVKVLVTPKSRRAGA
jgi:hypothetical protein